MSNKLFKDLMHGFKEIAMDNNAQEELCNSIQAHLDLEETILKWTAMTSFVLKSERFSLGDMQNLLMESYKVLTIYHKEVLVPKEVTKLFLEMADFLYFVSLVEGKEVGVDFYQYQYLSSIIHALKEGFFDGEYLYAFPKLQILIDGYTEHVIDFSKNIFADNLV